MDGDGTDTPIEPYFADAVLARKKVVLGKWNPFFFWHDIRWI